MNHDEIDQILSNEQQDILPSSGFVGSVMAAVRSQAATPPPIPFPWKRAFPGLAAAGFAIGSFVVVGVEELLGGVPATPSAPLFSTLAPIFDVAKTGGAAWIVLALLLTLISALLSMRLAER